MKILVKRILGVSIIIACLCALASHETRSEDKQASWKYRLTISIDTPKGIKSGSSVWEVIRDQDDISIIQNKTYGEAIAVDLGEKGILFGLIKGSGRRVDWIQRLLTKTYPNARGTIDEKNDYYNRAKKYETYVAPEDYPMMVHFADINVPESIETVYQTAVIDGKRNTVNRLEDVFGKGVKIKDVKLVITDDPVEWKLDRYLKWLKNISAEDLRRKLRNISFTIQYPGDYLEYNNFRRDK